MISEYERLEQFAYDNDILLLTGRLPGLSGFYYLNTEYGIKSITLSASLDTVAQKTCILAEELEHYVSTPQDLFTAPNAVRDKYENIARFAAIRRLMPFEKLLRCRAFCDIYEMADYLNITPEFIAAGLLAYKEHYGYSVLYRGYTIHFDPFSIKKTS